MSCPFRDFSVICYTAQSQAEDNDYYRHYMESDLIYLCVTKKSLISYFVLGNQCILLWCDWKLDLIFKIHRPSGIFFFLLSVRVGCNVTAPSYNVWHMCSPFWCVIKVLFFCFRGEEKNKIELLSPSPSHLPSSQIPSQIPLDFIFPSDF